MTVTNRQSTESDAVSARWLWGLGGAAALLFLLTLNSWLTNTSLGLVARWAGWTEQPELGRPLGWLICAVFRWLPARWLPLALNLFTAGSAALVLVQLARSVSILRYDSVVPNPMRSRLADTVAAPGAWKWLPPAFAVAALALQRSFWQHATAATGEMASVLCFAFAFRAILEYRRNAQEKWLYWGTLIYAVGMTDNWMMLAYAPVYLAAIIWAKGFGHCLEWRFFWRLSGCALLGWSLYFLVPWMISERAAVGADYWPTLRFYVAGQKNFLRILSTPAWRLLALTTVLPFLLLAVRWRSHSVQLADDTHAGIFLTKLTGHSIHLLFMLAALWLALNPLFAPGQNELNGALLVYQYAWALVAGYGLGYLLLFQWTPRRKRARRWPVVSAVALGLALPLLLVARNFNTIWLANGSSLKEFAAQLYEDLPAGPTIALSDEPWLLPLLRAELRTHDESKTPLLIETRTLATPAYLAQLAARYPTRWPEAARTNLTSLTPVQMTQLIRSLAAHEPAVYLHSSSGLFLEAFTAEPHGWTQWLKLRQMDEFGVVIAPSAETMQRQQERWEERWEQDLARRSRQFESHRQQVGRWNTPFWKALYLTIPTNETVTLLGNFYGKTLNQHGVELRRGETPAAATVWFERALELAPNNLAAKINLAANEPGGNEVSNRLTMAWAQQTFPRLMSQYQSWPDVIGRNGPVDAPVFLCFSGFTYLNGGCVQQAWECFNRSMILAPDWLAPRLEAAQTLNVLGRFTNANALSAELLTQESTLSPRFQARLLSAQAAALWGLGQTNAALDFIERFTTRHQQTLEVVGEAVNLCETFGDVTAGLKWSARLTELDPQNAESFVKKGRAELRAKDFTAARNTLTRALELAPDNHTARWLRAGAAVESGLFENAEKDYQALLKNADTSQSALFGLGSIAWRQRDTNAILRYYHAVLSNAPAVTPLTTIARERLKNLQDEAVNDSSN